MTPKPSHSPLAADHPLTGDERLLQLIHRASHAGRALRRLLADQAAEQGLSDAELLVIWLCERGPGLAQVELSAEVGMSPAQMSVTVERLRQRRLIDMQRSAVDRRRQVWRTTEDGLRLLVTARQGLAAAAKQLDQIVPTDHQQTAGALCEWLAEAMQQTGGLRSSHAGAAA